MLKTIEQKLRDKERQEIIRADQDTARSLQRFVKKARVNDKEELKERPTMTQYAQYSLENKYLAFEKAIKQAYNMVDNNLEFDGFVNVITAYNELINYIVSIAKYNSLSQSLRVPIDEKMNKLNGYLTNLIERSYVSKKYKLTSLEEMQDNIKNKIYKLVDIDINFKKFTADDTKKTDLNKGLTKGINILSATANNYKTVEGVKTQPLDLKDLMAELRAFRKENLNLSTKQGQEKLKKIEARAEAIKKQVLKKYKKYIPPEVLADLRLQYDPYSNPRDLYKKSNLPNPYADRGLLKQLEAQPSAQQALASMNYPVALSKREQIPLEAREEKFMQDPEKADVPAGQVLAPILAPEAVKGMEDAQDKFQGFFKQFKYPFEEQSAEEKINQDEDLITEKDALMEPEPEQEPEPAQKKKKGKVKVLKEYKLEPEQEPEYKEINIDPDFFEPDLSIEEQDKMNKFYDKTPLTGPLREKFVRLLAKRHKDRTGKTIEESIEYIRNGAKSGDIILDNRFSRLYLDNDPELNSILNSIVSTKKKDVIRKKTDYNTELYDEFSKEEHKEAKKLFDTYKSFIEDDTLIELLANEFIEKNPKYSKDYDFEQKQYFAKQMINKGIKDKRINLIDQVYRLKEQGNKKLLSMLKRITKL